MSKNPTTSETFPIVGIGASAGGLESLEEFFASLPAEPGMAFVVVQHLSPDFRSMMSELLSRYSQMPVLVAENSVEVRPNTVYLLPPRKEIRIEARRLVLSDKDPTNALTLPIDLFFRSLANDAGANSIAVVLSGSGSDGSRGIREIKRGGGVVLAESPETAKFNGMPLSALATGLVDFNGSARELAKFLLGGFNVASDGKPEGSDELDPDEPPMEGILRLLRRGFGLDFAVYKRGTVSRRIERRVAMREASSLEDYLVELQRDPDELTSLYRDMLIGVTRFFRDPDAFAIIEERVIPDIIDRVPETEEIRVWVAGCATGEEPYSLAMLLFEQLTARDRPMSFKVMATDVHRQSIEHASAGYYLEDQLVHVSEARRERFFTKRGNGFQISQDLRQRIVFAPHDITSDAPFTRMHLITCRNLLIYLEPEAQKTAISLLHFGLATNGYLFLGSSETVGRFTSEFEAIDEHWKIYRKQRDVRLLDPANLPMTRRTLGAAAKLLGTSRPLNSDIRLLPIYDRLLDRYMPPGFLVDEERNLVDSFGGAEGLLRVSPRRPTTNILDLLDGDIRTVVAGAIQRVFATGASVRYSGVLLEGDDRSVSIEAEPFVSTRNDQYVLLTLNDEAMQLEQASAAGEPPTELSGEEATAGRVRMLETELAYTRETLRSTVEEQQTSNEELQATNEELIASNEELQSTNEELHSVNEELYTVNGEYQKKILELRELNNDMQYLLEGSDIGTLFLDHELCIRKFTPRVAGIFHIRHDDVGRSIRDFSNDLDRPGLYKELEQTLRTGVVIEDEVSDDHGTTYFLRVLPYVPASGGENNGGDPFAAVAPGPIEGVMLSLTDISALDHARARIRELSAIVESSTDAIISKDLEGIIATWNQGAERLYGYSSDEAVGRNIRMLAPPGYDTEIDEFMESIRRGQGLENVETVRTHKNGSLLDVSVTLSPVYDRDGEVVGASAIARDITELKRAQRELEEREERIRLLLDSTAEAIYGLDRDGVCTFCNPACVRMLGFESAEALIGQRMHQLVHHSRTDGAEYLESECPIYTVLRSGRGTHADDEVLYRADGSSFPAEYWSYPVRRNGRVDGAVVTFIDITDRKNAEAEIRLAAKRREQFLAMLSHELRNPLAATLNATSVLKSESSQEVRDEARDVIDRQCRHIARLLDDLLDVSRITRGGIELRKEDLDLREPIELAVESVAPQLAERDTQLELDLPEQPLPVRGDRARLQQVVGNLLTNAAKYSPRGSHVQLSARRDGDRIVLSVIDNGDGIEADILPEIFELFVQTAQGLDRADGGLGVGLALVRQLVELHQGRVEAHSDGLGQGSEFRVILPLQTHAILTKQVPKQKISGSRRIVLVEDHADSREMLRMLLEAMGFVVFEAQDGEDAIATIERVHPDVALVDIGLPVIDGYSVARKLRSNAAFDDVLLVALTGYGTDHDIQAAREAGFNEHLTKPADPSRIEELLRRSR